MMPLRTCVTFSNADGRESNVGIDLLIARPRRHFRYPSSAEHRHVPMAALRLRYHNCRARRSGDVAYWHVASRR